MAKNIQNRETSNGCEVMKYTISENIKQQNIEIVGYSFALELGRRKKIVSNVNEDCVNNYEINY